MDNIDPRLHFIYLHQDILNCNLFSPRRQLSLVCYLALVFGKMPSTIVITNIYGIDIFSLVLRYDASYSTHLVVISNH
jgi:hypothetical protein